MTIILAIILGFIVYKLRKQIRRNSTALFVITGVIAVISYIVDFELVTIGTVGFTMFLLVMFAGAFKKNSKIGKGLKSIRRELSIMGFILLIPHFWKYLLEFMNGEYPWEWYGIIGALIMIPLFITSFTRIKRMFSHKTWKAIQRYSYLAYVLIFVHLIIVASEAEAIMYSTLLVAYLGLKYINYFSKSGNQIVKTVSGLSVMTSLVFVVLYNTDIEVTAVSSKDSLNINEVIDLNSIEDGTYYGSADGFKSKIVELEVIVVNNEITDISVLNYGSTTPHKGVDFYDAVNQVVNKVIENPGETVDAISGATKSTEGALHAIEDALT